MPEDRWVFESRLHCYIEYLHWDKLQQLRIKSPKNILRRGSYVHITPVSDSKERPDSQPQIKSPSKPEVQVCDRAFLRKVSGGGCGGGGGLSLLPTFPSSRASSNTAHKSVTFILPQTPVEHEVEDTEGEK